MGARLGGARKADTIASEYVRQTGRHGAIVRQEALKQINVKHQLKKIIGTHQQKLYTVPASSCIAGFVDEFPHLNGQIINIVQMRELIDSPNLHFLRNKTANSRFCRWKL